MKFEENEKFSILAIQDVYTELPEQWQQTLSDGTRVFTEFPLALEPEWEKWLGTLRVQSLRDSNLVIVQTLRSKTPGILDNEQKELFTHLHELFHVLQLSGVLHYEGADLLTGAFFDKRTSVQQFHRLPPFYETPESESMPVGLERLEEACHSCQVLLSKKVLIC